MKERHVVILSLAASAVFVITVRSCTDSPRAVNDAPSLTDTARNEGVSVARVDHPTEAATENPPDAEELPATTNPPAAEHHTFAGKAIAAAKENQADHASDHRPDIEKGRALIAKGFNRDLSTIARNELPLTCEIKEIRKPIWGYPRHEATDRLIGVTTITYLTDEGKTLVALATFEGGKWHIGTGDDFNLLETPKKNADALMITLGARLSPRLDVPD